METALEMISQVEINDTILLIISALLLIIIYGRNQIAKIVKKTKTTLDDKFFEEVVDFIDNNEEDVEKILKKTKGKVRENYKSLKKK